MIPLLVDHFKSLGYNTTRYHEEVIVYLPPGLVGIQVRDCKLAVMIYYNHNGQFESSDLWSVELADPDSILKLELKLKQLSEEDDHT